MITAERMKTLLSDPKTLIRKVKQKASSAAPHQSQTAVSKTLAQRIEEIQAANYKVIAIIGDQGFYDNAKAHLQDIELIWISEDYAVQMLGAAHPSTLTERGFDVVLTGGRNVVGQYNLALRYLERDSENPIPILWVSDHFEFCAGSLSFASDIDDADIYLFNHFEIYFGIKDSLLVTFEVFDTVQSKKIIKLMSPNETICFKLNDLLPERQGASGITVYVDHPSLTRGRHYRWRFFADIYKGDSIASLHGAHDLRGNDVFTTFSISKSGHGEGKVQMTLPNFQLDMADPKVVCINGEAQANYLRNNTQRIDDISFQLPANEADANKDLCGCHFQGYGGSFWYAYTSTGSEHYSLSSNHSVGRPYPLFPEETSFSEQPHFKSLKDKGYVFWPYPVPVTSKNSEVEYGISFSETYPLVSNLRILFFDINGQMLKDTSFKITEQKPLYTDEILAVFPEIQDQAAMIMFAPEMDDVRVSKPARWSANVNFYARLRATLDFDITEFQSAWRNIGTNIKEFPHWIAPPMSYLGRSNLYGRAVSKPDMKTALLLVNASGYLGYDLPAEVKVTLFDKSKQIDSVDLKMDAFTHKFIWLDELFNDLDKKLGRSGYGAVLIQSKNADINAQMVSRYKDKGLSFQHLWGY